MNDKILYFECGQSQVIIVDAKLLINIKLIFRGTIIQNGQALLIFDKCDTDEEIHLTVDEVEKYFNLQPKTS
jgi:hypothetical protein